MEEEAERVEMKLRETTLAGSIITAAHETDPWKRHLVDALAHRKG
jgi:hypothetical protein